MKILILSISIWIILNNADIIQGGSYNYFPTNKPVDDYHHSGNNPERSIGASSSQNSKQKMNGRYGNSAYSDEDNNENSSPYILTCSIVPKKLGYTATKHNNSPRSIDSPNIKRYSPSTSDHNNNHEDKINYEEHPGESKREQHSKYPFTAIIIPPNEDFLKEVSSSESSQFFKGLDDINLNLKAVPKVILFPNGHDVVKNLNSNLNKDFTSSSTGYREEGLNHKTINHDKIEQQSSDLNHEARSNENNKSPEYLKWDQLSNEDIREIIENLGKINYKPILIDESSSSDKKNLQEEKSNFENHSESSHTIKSSPAEVYHPIIFLDEPSYNYRPTHKTGSFDKRTETKKTTQYNDHHGYYSSNHKQSCSHIEDQHRSSPQLDKNNEKRKNDDVNKSIVHYSNPDFQFPGPAAREIPVNITQKDYYYTTIPSNEKTSTSYVPTFDQRFLETS